MREHLRFRMVIGALVLVAAAIFYLSFRSHHVPRDNDVLPQVPPGDAPPPART